MTVTRRDGEALVLMSQREAEGRARLLDFAAQLITVTLDDRGSLAERMSNAFPWMLALSLGRPGVLRTGPRRCGARVVLHRPAAPRDRRADLLEGDGHRRRGRAQQRQRRSGVARRR
ncbi:hypothetical protein ACQ4WX_39755 [Streptomyces lasalocidi]